MLQHEGDTWIATASAQGEAHLVPLSLSWDGSSIVLATVLLDPPRSGTLLRRVGHGWLSAPAETLS